LRAFEAKPLDKARRGKRPSVTARAGREAALPTTRKTASRDGASEPAQVLSDPDTRFRLARACPEETKLRKWRGETLDRKDVQRRVFAIARLFRDIQDAAVSREAPLMAARLGIDEGVAKRELKAFMNAISERVQDGGRRSPSQVSVM
jgi:hypothetical protein